MLIGNDWKVEADNMNVMLYQKKMLTNRKTKKEYEWWDVVGYFATVKGALHELVNQKIRDTQLKDLKIVMAEVEDLHNMIEHIREVPVALREALVV